MQGIHIIKGLFIMALSGGVCAAPQSKNVLPARATPPSGQGFNNDPHAPFKGLLFKDTNKKILRESLSCPSLSSGGLSLENLPPDTDKKLLQEIEPLSRLSLPFEKLSLEDLPPDTDKDSLGALSCQSTEPEGIRSFGFSPDAPISLSSLEDLFSEGNSFRGDVSSESSELPEKKLFGHSAPSSPLAHRKSLDERTIFEDKEVSSQGAPDSDYQVFFKTLGFLTCPVENSEFVTGISAWANKNLGDLCQDLFVETISCFGLPLENFEFFLKGAKRVLKNSMKGKQSPESSLNELALQGLIEGDLDKIDPQRLIENSWGMIATWDNPVVESSYEDSKRAFLNALKGIQGTVKKAQFINAMGWVFDQASLYAQDLKIPVSSKDTTED